MQQVDQPQFWFKRRRYGYGWTPCAWQGWVAVGVFISLTVVAAFAFEHLVGQNEWQYVGLFLGFIAIELVVLLLVTLRHGPPPKWRWGKQSTDSPTEDW